MPCSEKLGSKCSIFSDSRIAVSSLPMPENTKPLPASKVGILRMKTRKSRGNPAALTSRLRPDQIMARMPLKVALGRMATEALASSGM